MHTAPPLVMDQLIGFSLWTTTDYSSALFNISKKIGSTFNVLQFEKSSKNCTKLDENNRKTNLLN